MLERRSGVHRREGFMHCWWKMPDARLWETFHWSRVISFPSPPAGLFQKKLTIKENKAKSRLRSSTHTYTQCTRFPPWIFVLFFVGQYPLGFSPHSSVQETTRILASSCVCVSRFSFLFTMWWGFLISFFISTRKKTELTERKFLARNAGSPGIRQNSAGS